MDEDGFKHNNAIDNVHKEEDKDSKSEHRFISNLELRTIVFKTMDYSHNDV